jgi:signal peptidase II
MAEALRQDRVMRLKLWSPLAPLVMALAALVFGLDQTHKWWMINVYGIAAREPVTVAPFLELVIVWNRGVSYGLFTSHTQELLIAMGLVITLGLWVWACRMDKALGASAVALVIGGALANVLDRIIRGAVADFFHFHYGNFSWYVFNLADVAIVAGVALLLYESMFVSGAGDRRGKAGIADH